MLCHPNLSMQGEMEIRAIRLLVHTLSLGLGGNDGNLDSAPNSVLIEIAPMDISAIRTNAQFARVVSPAGRKRKLTDESGDKETDGWNCEPRCQTFNLVNLGLAGWDVEPLQAAQIRDIP